MKPLVLFVTSHPLSIQSFLLPHFRVLKSEYDIRVMVNTTAPSISPIADDALVEHLPIRRKLSPYYDLWALLKLTLRIYRLKPLVVHTITPKAGLIGMLAAWLACVPLRVHTFTGQVWVTRTGFVRWSLRLTDRLIAVLATNVVVDSRSQCRFLINEGVIDPSTAVVLGRGSVCGVDIWRFVPAFSTRARIRAQFRTSNNAIVCLYLGRLSRDKGLLDLARAFECVATRQPRAQLWIVGPEEDLSYSEIVDLMPLNRGRLRRADLTERPETFMQAADLFCLPSYREGFGSTVIEAAACGVPALVSRIYGLADTIIEGETGWMHEPGNVVELVEILDKLLSRPEEVKEKGKKAREFVTNTYSQTTVVEEMFQFYRRLTADWNKP